jgi:hypothetical protein
MKSLLRIGLREDEFEDALYGETHLFSFASRNAVSFLLKTSTNLREVLGRQLTYWLRQVLIETNIVLQVGMGILVSDREKDPASVSTLQKCSVDDDDAATICHRVLAGFADRDRKLALKRDVQSGLDLFDQLDSFGWDSLDRRIKSLNGSESQNHHQTRTTKPPHHSVPLRFTLSFTYRQIPVLQ